MTFEYVAGKDDQKILEQIYKLLKIQPGDKIVGEFDDYIINLSKSSETELDSEIFFKLLAKMEKESGGSKIIDFYDETDNVA